MDKEIDRPLGQDGEPGRGRPNITVKTVVAGLVVCAVIGASTAIALRPRPFRTPVVEAPPAAKAEPAARPAKPPAAPAAAGAGAARAVSADAEPAKPGPEIIHVGVAEPASPGKIIIEDPSAAGRNLRYAHLPDRALIEQSEMGPLPVRGPDGQRPMDVYARPSSQTSGPRVAIVIGGLGLSQTGTQAAIKKLPGEVTLAFAPQGNSLGRWMRYARQTGHEIIMQIPLEPYDYPNVNPGRNTLTIEGSAYENIRDLHWALSRITNYTGVMNYMGGRFVTDKPAMDRLLSEIGRRGLLYLDDGSSARSVAPEIAEKDDVPFAQADETIDTLRDRGNILNKLDELEQLARSRGYAIGTGSAFDVTVGAVADWVQQAERQGIAVVPISALVSDPEKGRVVGRK